MNIKRNTIFLLDKEKGKPDAKLRFRVKWGNNIVAFGVGHRVDIDKWISEAQRCRTNTTHGKKKVHSSVINKDIQHFEELCETVFFFFEQNEKVPTADEFREKFNEMNGKRDTKCQYISDYYNEFMLTESVIRQWTESTYKTHRATRTHLRNFAPKLEFPDLDEKGLNMYVDYLLSLTDNEGNPLMRNTTVKKEIDTLKWFLRWASKKGYNKNMYFESFSPKLKTIPKKVIFLEWDELMRVWKANIPDNKKYLHRVRDKFLFSCFTSLRYSDIEKLTWENVSDNLEYIEIVSVKTDDPLRIELNKYSRGILEKYERKNGNVFPKITNQKMNSYLKELCQMCEIDKPVTVTYYQGSERIEETLPKYKLISTHTGRRTFICQALMLDIPPNIVMKWTGHSDYNAMKPYIEIADSAKKEAMSLFDK